VNLKFSIKEICEIINAPLPKEESLHNASIQNVIIDSRSPRIGEHSLFYALKGNRSDGHQYLETLQNAGCGFAVVSSIDENLELNQLLVEDTIFALQLLAAAHRSKFSYPVIGITGSNGKTIVKEWLYHVLKSKFSIVRSPKSFNSQIGVALSVLEMTSDANLGIFEAGISQVNEMENLADMIQPTLGVFTGIGDAHDANFESKEEKRVEKYKLFTQVSEVIECEPLAELKTIIPFKDEASIKNASTVLETAVHLGITKEEAKEKLVTLPSISMRLEQIEGRNNCTLLNDAYTADMAALEIALRYLDEVATNRKKVLILSLSDEQLKMIEDDAISSLIYKASLNQIIFIGSENLLANARIAGGYFKTTEAYLEDPVDFEDAVVLFKGSRSINLEKIVQHYTLKKHVTQLEVNLSAMRNNLNHFRNAIANDVLVLAMVKAQSYGTGLVDIAKFMQQESVNYLGVAYADEGVALREAGITLPIMVMNPEANAFDEIIDYDLEPSIFSPEVLQSFIHQLILRQKTNFPIHIKLDTGMNRLGFIHDEIPELIQVLNTQPEVFVKSGFSHLSVADDTNERTFTFGQIREFEIMTGALKDGVGYAFKRHLANSSATLNYPQAHFDMIRVGIGLYGLMTARKKELENVLTLHSQLSQIKHLKEGDSVGYGREFIARKEEKIGIVPIGYADGIRRGLSEGKWFFIINGKKAPIIGKICMDMCMVNLEGIDAKVGDAVQMLGEGNSVFDMAKELYTIPYEVISSISSRVHRVYLG
jgi:alanine racemase